MNSGLIAECAGQNGSYLPFYPVGGKDDHHKLSAQSLLKPIAEKYQTSVYCVLLNWLLRLQPNVIPIPGATRSTSILDSVKAVNFELDDEDFARVGTLA